jgi:hypothetical protein
VSGGESKEALKEAVSKRDLKVLAALAAEVEQACSHRSRAISCSLAFQPTASR